MKGKIEAVEEYKDVLALKLFKKNRAELNIEELLLIDRYIFDSAHPEWRPIYVNGKKTKYSASNTGFIRNDISAKIRKPVMDTNGYMRIMLSINGHAITKKVHRIIAQTFIPNPENKPQVNHINGDKTLNWVGNLEWNTPKENVKHSYETGLVTNHAKGERIGTNKYKENQIHEVCKLLQDPTARYEDIEKATGVSYDVIAKIGTGELWVDIVKEYNIPKRVRTSSRYSTEFIENICKMLANGIKPVEIQRITGIPWATLSQIKTRNLYTYISNKYAF